MSKIVFSNHLGRVDGSKKHVHLLRDWSGAMIPGNVIFPPIEMLYAISYLREKGHDAGLVDGNCTHQTFEASVNEVLGRRPDFVVTVSSWLTLENDLELLAAIKKERPDCKTILCGPNVTCDPDAAMKSSAVDVVALGEFVDGVEEAVSGKLRQNVVYRRDGEVIHTPFVPMEDLDQIPYAAWDVVDRKRFWVPFTRNNPFALALSGLGCPHGKCLFCHEESYFGDHHRSHSAQYVIGEMDYLNSIGFREVIYRDQCFTARPDVVEALCDHLIQKGSPVTWRVSTRVDLVSQDLLDLMSKAGCYQISFGFESFSPAALLACKKGATVEDGYNAARWAKEAGMEISGGFIFGLPGEELASTRQWLQQIRRRDIDFPQFFVLSHIFDYKNRKFVPLIEDPKEIKRLQSKMLRLALAFYFNPIYLARQVHRVISKEGLKRFLGIFYDFLRYFFLR